ncbi:hypothetical protein [Dysgonomonas sp. 511]|uniref:hypothetical protein n=1 Tax=Dysgonomonas sp. 511 TaxID=2302930 RepID=UPI0013D77CBB|nr:hypothetical protein [Dysgonomonas sp. 511]NDV77827.1 hypothetical protein [Dysgonomonas sp. 511]
MKKILFTLSLIITIFLASCSVYEDIYLLENNGLKYNMTLDASEMMAMVSQSSMPSKTKLPKDSVISFAQMAKDSLQISDDIKEDLKNIEPLFVRIQNDDETGILKISLFGEFENTDAYSKAFASLGKLSSKAQELKANPSGKFPIERFSAHSQLSWDGKTFKRITKSSGENDDEDDGKIDESMKKMFAQGKLIVKYHMPKKIKKISNQDATLTIDGKTAVVQYSGTQITKPSEVLSIEIETE